MADLTHAESRQLREAVQNFQAIDAQFGQGAPYYETDEEGQTLATHQPGEPECDIPQAEEYLRRRRELGELVRELGQKLEG